MKKQRRRRRPGLLLHKPTGQGRVILGGQTHYLGKFHSPECAENYARLIRAWERNGHKPLSPGAIPGPDRHMSLGELADRYWESILASGGYLKNGRPTSARGRIEKALREFKETAGGLPVRELSKATLAHHRDRMSEQGDLTAYGVNKKIAELKRFAAWAEERGYISEGQAVSLSRLRPLKEGTKHRREAVPMEDLKATIDLLEKRNPLVADMVRIQFLLGCRPGEVCAMRWRDIDRTAGLQDGTTFWLYRVSDGKTGVEHYPINEEAQAILSRHLKRNHEVPVFSTSDTRLQFGHECSGKHESPYRVASYRQAIRRAACEAGVPVFTPHQIRHLAVSVVANHAQGGTGAAAALANHATRRTTDTYIHQDRRLAVSGAKLLTLAQ